ncbi:MAG: FHA domain-containing protein [Planctomycetes bacterium]|nr:FHA domain-containing protein [Planctomycetota bacterium]
MTTSSWRTDLIALSDSDPAKRQRAAAQLAHAPESAFEAVRNLVMEKAFCDRDPAEALAILRALKAINGIRAIGVFYELASRTGLVSAKTRLIAELASDLLEEPDDTPSPDLEDDEKTSLEITAPPMKRPGIKEGPFSGLGGPPTERMEAKTSRISASDMWQDEAQGQPDQEPPVPWTNFRYTEEEAQRALAWLRCPPFDPVPVGVKDVFNIGRSKKGDLILAHPSVSRVHAVIRVSGKEMLIEDRSTYGTWVNGERVMSHAIAIGDTITIGPYDVLVEKSSAGDEEDDMHDTRPLRTFASSEAIGGRIERVSLAEVLQQMEFNQKTGTLTVFSDDGVTGTLVVYDGAPMYAEFGEARDNQAVINMLSLKKGSFSLLNKIEPGEMTMQGTLTGILLEASRQIDEG